MIIMKIYLGISLELLWVVWRQFSFRQLLVPAYTSQDLQAPYSVVGANYRVLICCTCHSQSHSLYLFWLLLFASLRPDTRWQRWYLFKLTCSVVLQGGRNTANKYHWRVWGVITVSRPHWVCPCSQHVCFLSLPCLGSRLLCRGTV